ncbi:MAG: hypothetical protein V2A73_16440 [Pseudomonadota bacterium]
MYATVEDLRAEGVTEAMVSDARLASLIVEAGRTIDRITGWFFEPRALTLVLDGRGTPTIELPVPSIRLDRITVSGKDLALDQDELAVIGAPIGPGFDVPWLTRKAGRVFPRGTGNMEATGLWGFTEADGTPEGRTPLEIRRACMLFVLRLLHPLTDQSAADARNRWRIIEERTRDQSYRLDGMKVTGPFAGDPEIDGILLRYRRPPSMGAA